MTLTSREGYHTWNSYLLQNVNLSSFIKIYSFYLSLLQKPELGAHVRQITMVESQAAFEARDFHKEDSACGTLNKAWLLITSMEKKRFIMEEIISIIKHYILDNCENLETLVLVNTIFPFPLLRNIPSRYLSKSLKRFHAGSNTVQGSLTCQNVVWLLVFCSTLEQVSVKFIVSASSFKFLVEYSETFIGLSSVVQLALEPTFAWDAFDGTVGSWKGHLQETKEWK